MDPRVTSPARRGRGPSPPAPGFKLHPRAEDFRLDDPGVGAMCAVGRGRTSAGTDPRWRRGRLLRRDRHATSLPATRECPLILAHAGVSDLAWLWRGGGRTIPTSSSTPPGGTPATWIALFALVPPGQILFGSDEPYMDFGTVLAIRCAAPASPGLPADAIELVAGRPARAPARRGGGGRRRDPLRGRPRRGPRQPSRASRPCSRRPAAACSAAAIPGRMFETRAARAVGVDGSAIPAAGSRR